MVWGRDRYCQREGKPIIAKKSFPYGTKCLSFLQIVQMLKCAQKAQIGKSYAGRSNLHTCIDSNGKFCYSPATNVTQSEELLNESKEGLDCWGVEGLPDDLLSKDLPNKYSPDKDMFGPQFSLWSIKNMPNANSLRWFFDITSVSPAKLIQFAFHDCLR